MLMQVAEPLLPSSLRSATSLGEGGSTPQSLRDSSPTKGSLTNYLRVAAQPYLRRDPNRKPTLLLLTEWVSKGTKSLRGDSQGAKPLGRSPEAEPLVTP